MKTKQAPDKWVLRWKTKKIADLRNRPKPEELTAKVTSVSGSESEARSNRICPECLRNSQIRPLPCVFSWTGERPDSLLWRSNRPEMHWTQGRAGDRVPRRTRWTRTHAGCWGRPFCCPPPPPSEPSNPRTCPGRHCLADPTGTGQPETKNLKIQQRFPAKPLGQISSWWASGSTSASRGLGALHLVFGLFLNMNRTLRVPRHLEESPR